MKVDGDIEFYNQTIHLLNQKKTSENTLKKV